MWIIPMGIREISVEKFFLKNLTAIRNPHGRGFLILA